MSGEETPTVRTVKEDADLRGAIRAHGRAWKEAYQGILPDAVLADIPTEPTDDLVDQWKERLSEGRETFLIAVDEAGTTRGYVYLRWADGTKEFVHEREAGLKEIYVDPDVWGEGIGTALLREGLERLPDHIERIKLEVLADNEIGIRFYEARGFSRVSESEHEIGGNVYDTAVYVREVGEPS